jgi:hypothetical protein
MLRSYTQQDLQFFVSSRGSASLLDAWIVTLPSRITEVIELRADSVCAMEKIFHLGENIFPSAESASLV